MFAALSGNIYLTGNFIVDALMIATKSNTIQSNYESLNIQHVDNLQGERTRCVLPTSSDSGTTRNDANNGGDNNNNMDSLWLQGPSV